MQHQSFNDLPGNRFLDIENILHATFVDILPKMVTRLNVQKLRHNFNLIPELSHRTLNKIANMHRTSKIGQMAFELFEIFRFLLIDQPQHFEMGKSANEFADYSIGKP